MVNLPFADQAKDCLFGGGSKDQPTNATLAIVPRREDDGVIFKCVVWNRAMNEGQRLETTTTLNVFEDFHKDTVRHTYKGMWLLEELGADDFLQKESFILIIKCLSEDNLVKILFYKRFLFQLNDNINNDNPLLFALDVHTFLMKSSADN
uniref:Uncharacterized protein n=1 Tax=Glossina pallidipes TaxID=7398 RepID=A0A1A9ZI15_GLOPL